MLFVSKNNAFTLQNIIRKTKRKHLFKRSDKTRKTNCTPEKSPCFNYNLTNEH